VEFVLVFVLQVGSFDLLHDADDEVAGAYEGIEDVDAFVAEGAAEFFLQNLFDAAHHEVDDGLRSVDDAVGVGFFGRIALEEALVDFVEECLLLREAGGVFGADFDGFVESGRAGAENSFRLNARLVSSTITFSISAATTLRRVKSGLSKILSKMRSVSRCWINMRSTASSERLGLMAWRQRA